MKVCTYFLLFRILALTKTTSTIIRRENLKSVYLTQDTPEFNHKKYHRGTKDLINENDDNNEFKADMRTTGDKTFTEFITGVIKILNTYGDTAFEDFFHIFDNEIRRYHYRGCKFSELTKNYDTREFLASTLKIVKEQHVSDTRADINSLADTLKDEANDENVKELLDYINFVYRHAGQKFTKVLNDLKDYRNSKSIRTHNKLQEVIRNGVRSVLFDHYTQLDGYTRLELVNRIQTYWDQAKNYREPRAKLNNETEVKPAVNSAKMIENFINVYLGPDVPKGLATIKVLPSEENSDSHEISSREKGGKSNEYEKLTKTNYKSSELLSGQSFDTSSSIKKSHERHEMYNTQRYMTLYTEEVSYKATTRKTKIVLRAANVTKKPKRTTAKSITKYSHNEMTSVRLRTGKERDREYIDTASSQDISDSNHDTASERFLMSYKQKAKHNLEKPQKRNKPIISKTTKNRHDVVKLTESATDTKHPKVMLAKATTRSQHLIARRKSLEQLKPYSSNDRTQINKSKVRLIPSDEGLSIETFKTDDYLQIPVRRSGNDTIKEKDFNEYVVKRLDTLEKKIEELKQKKDFKSEAANITENNEVKTENESNTHDKKLPAVVKLHQESDSRNIAMNTALVTKLNAVTNDDVNITTADDTNITRDAPKNSTNLVTTEADIEIANNNVISTTESSVMATTVKNDATTATEPADVAYSEPPPNQFYNPLDPFEHINDGLDLGM